MFILSLLNGQYQSFVRFQNKIDVTRIQVKMFSNDCGVKQIGRPKKEEMLNVKVSPHEPGRGLKTTQLRLR